MSIEEGSTCIVTGASSGIGKVAAAEFARMGARVVMVCRSRERGRTALVEICQATGNTQVELILADLSEMNEVRSVAARIRDKYPQIDVLLNNAGAIHRPRQLTSDGYERTFALNHLAPFLLTLELEANLRASAPARVITVSSDAHRFGRIRFDDLHGEKKYLPFRAYAQSKLANILFATELARRLDGSGVTSNAVHPGTVATGFGRNNKDLLGWLVRWGARFLKTPEQGARTMIWLATDDEVENVSGGYFVNEKSTRPSKAALDDETSARLWQVSLELTRPSTLGPDPQGRETA